MKLWLETNADHIRMASEAAEAASKLDLDKFLLRFLRAQKFHVGRAEAMMEKYLKLRRQKSKWFEINLDSNVLELLRNGFVTLFFFFLKPSLMHLIQLQLPNITFFPFWI